ncbi:MAG: DUF4062 domain-containing protein [Defluviitaleaceae bacterium]|nr:DUF4062 domain-containing protein [Defluviitaleaceae bacterium]
MPAPKIFVSSTCYDLRQIRQDIEGFIKSFGYLAILSEKHSVTYNVKESLEADCYNELSSCEMLIGIVGGRYGSESSDNSGNSISMNEMLKAIELNKQSYIFIDKNVNTEFHTYSRNIGKEMEYAFVDDVRIFEFIEKLRGKANIVVINDFSTANDITDCLRAQWAGLFQTFLYNKEQQRQSEGLLTIKTVIEGLLQASDKLSEGVDEIILNSNSFFSSTEVTRQTISPLLAEISRELIGDKNGLILLRNRIEMDSFLKDILGFKDSYFRDHNSTEQQYHKGDLVLHVDFGFIFDENKKHIHRTTKEVKEYEEKNKKKFIYTEDVSTILGIAGIEDDDLPF